MDLEGVRLVGGEGGVGYISWEQTSSPIQKLYACRSGLQGIVSLPYALSCTHPG